MSAELGAAQATGLGVLHIEASDLASAHAALGRELRSAIALVIEQRLARTAPVELATQIRAIRHSRAHLERKAREAALPAHLRGAIADYFAALCAWARGAELASLTPRIEVDGRPLSADDLAFWLQDDNTGCQTGVTRVQDGSVLLWHTEEDTIGLFDRARILALRLGSQQLSAFLYPYLLPGPAFSWWRSGVLAYDTLSVRRTETGGTPTSVLSWLLWATQGELPALQTAHALAPYLDGGAFTLVERREGGVHAQVIEVGGHCVSVASLPGAAGARRLQVNAVSEQAGELRAIEVLSEAERDIYRERVARAERMLDACASGPSEAELQAMLASTDGGTWAFANADVVAHLVARIGLAETSLRVGVGPAPASGARAAHYQVR